MVEGMRASGEVGAVTAPRRRVAAALLRATLTSTVLVVLYFRLPLTGALEASTVALLLAGLALFAGVIIWQVQSILRSEYPALRAIEALAAAVPLFLIVFAAAYFTLADSQAQAFNEPLSRTDALYFTITVFATVGFGDIAPVSDGARVVAIVQMLGDLLVFGLVLRVMLGAVKAGRERRRATGPEASPSLARHDGPGT
jgi:voltage-gated potassium channel